MYPLEVFVVGADDHLLPHLRRELMNLEASVEAEFADIEGAVNGVPLASERSRVLIVRLGDPRDLPLLSRLTRTFVGQPVLVLMDPGAPRETLLTAMRAGVAQVVMLPLQPDDFQAAMRTIALQFGHPGGRARLIAVTGANGGCGATTIALNLAYELAFQNGQDCILAELSHNGVLATYLNIEPRYTTTDLLRMGDRLDVHAVQQALTRFANHLFVLTGPYQFIPPLAVESRTLGRLIEHAKRLAHVVVLDLPSTYDDLYFETLAHASEVLLVGEQKVASVRSLELLKDTMRRGTDVAMARLVINRYDAEIPGFSGQRLSELLSMPSFSTIVNDPVAMTAAANNGRPLRLEAVKSAALADIKKLAGALSSGRKELSPEPVKSNVFGRLVRAFGLA